MCGLALLGGAAHADAATRTWKAFTVDNNWSNPANWEEGAAPVNGDDLVFPVPGVPPGTMVNDIAALQVNSIVTSSSYSISGQPFMLAHGMRCSGMGPFTIVYDTHVTAAGDQTWTLDQCQVTINSGVTFNGTFTVFAGIFSPGTLRIPGVLSGNGTLIVTGAITLELLGANDYTGPTIVEFGSIRVGQANALGVGDGTIGNGTLLRGGRLAFADSVVLDDELIELRGGGSSLSAPAGVAPTITGPIHWKEGMLPLNFPGGLTLTGSLELTGMVTDSSGPDQLPQIRFSDGALGVTGTDLSLVLPEGFSAPMGQTFTIIDFGDGSGITGTFEGLAEGATFTAGSLKFAISYVGGDGNDVVLTVVGVDLSYYLSEGATGSFFSTDILLANPNNAGAPVTVTFLRPGGAAPIVVTQNLPAFSRRTIHANDVDGLEEASFSTVVRSDDALPIVVERTMSWDQTGYGSHTEKATEGPSTQWFFAEGSQGFFFTYVLLTNPHPEANSATVQYLLEGADAITRTYPLDPESRFTIDVGADSELVGKTFGMTVTFDLPGVAERAMYFGVSPLWKGGHESIGVTAPATDWFLAEGATGTFFETFVLLANPNAVPVSALVSFRPAGGNEVTRSKVIPANGRVTLNIEQEDPSLASAPVATTVTSQLPLIVERSQYWPDPAPQWYEAHNSFGVTALSRKWGLAEGRVGGADNAQTYILLATEDGGSVKVTFLRESGIPVQKTFQLPARTRFNIAVGSAQVPEITNERFGVLLEATTPIAVERALYWDAGGAVWAAGSNATATRLP